METARTATAVAKYIRMSPIKLKPVTELVRGKSLNEALTILKFTPGKGSEIIEKVMESAAANAENNFDMNPDDLYVADVYANQGPTMKRWRAGSQGRASIILKRSSHVGVTLKEMEGLETPEKPEKTKASKDKTTKDKKSKASDYKAESTKDDKKDKAEAKKDDKKKTEKDDKKKTEKDKDDKKKTTAEKAPKGKSDKAKPDKEKAEKAKADKDKKEEV